MPKSYIPDAGDIVWLEFDPQAGREQAGHRPALVLSPASYNDKVSLAVCCPLSTKVKEKTMTLQSSFLLDTRGHDGGATIASRAHKAKKIPSRFSLAIQTPSPWYIPESHICRKQ